MKTLLAIFLVVAGAVAVAATLFFSNSQIEAPVMPTAKQSNLQEPQSSGSIYFLSAKAIHELSARASTGDGDAAFRLYQYYALSTADRSQQRRWLEAAANAGNATAQHNLASELLEAKNFSEAKKWALEAQKNGDAKAKNLLIEIEKN
jgi:TPR repeat protein